MWGFASIEWPFMVLPKFNMLLFEKILGSGAFWTITTWGRSCCTFWRYALCYQGHCKIRSHEDLSFILGVCRRKDTDYHLSRCENICLNHQKTFALPWLFRRSWRHRHPQYCNYSTGCMLFSLIALGHLLLTLDISSIWAAWLLANMWRGAWSHRKHNHAGRSYCIWHLAPL